MRWDEEGRLHLLHLEMAGGNDPSSCGVYLSFLEGGVDVFVLLKLLEFGLDQNLSDVHHLLHRESQALHWVTELLLEEKHTSHQQTKPYIRGSGNGWPKTVQQQEVMGSAAEETNTMWMCEQYRKTRISSKEKQPLPALQQKTKHAVRWWRWKHQSSTVLCTVCSLWSQMKFPLTWQNDNEQMYRASW